MEALKPTTIANLVNLEPQKTTLDLYIEEVKADTQLDELIVKDVQMKLPGLKHKWVGRLIRTKASLQRLQRDKEKLRKTTAEEIRKKSPVAVSIPIAEKTAESSDSIIALSEKIQEHILLIEFLERVEKIFSSMTFDIKNLIEILKLEQL